MSNRYSFDMKPTPSAGSVVYVEETCKRGCCVERAFRATFRELAGNGNWICTTGIGEEQKEVLVSPFDVKRLDDPGVWVPERVAPPLYRTKASGATSA